MDHEEVSSLRRGHPAWRLLRADNATLILAFLGEFFVEGNRGACAAGEVGGALDDLLYALNESRDAHRDVAPGGTGDEPQEEWDLPEPVELVRPGPRYPKPAQEYLEDWAASEAGFLRRFYPPGDSEVHYEVTPGFEKAYGWVSSLRQREFVGTESRLHTVVELLRQIAHGTEVDPQVRLAELRRRRAEIEAEIAEVESGAVVLLDPTGIRDRFQQLSATARELLSDFREVEENFRSLDRATRERFVAAHGSRGAVLDEMLGSRSQITNSDQGRSFHAFYEFLLSERRQSELSELLSKVAGLEEIEADRRFATVHHDWAEAAERVQHTVRVISEQLRRFLDDESWRENRRVLDLVRQVKATALAVRADPPDGGLEVDEFGVDVVLPTERPLFSPPQPAAVDSHLQRADGGEVDAEALFAQAYIDRDRLLDNIRSTIPARTTARLADIIAARPIEQGVAEVVGYLALDDDTVTVDMQDGETMVEFRGPRTDRPDADSHDDRPVRKRLRMPEVTVTRR